MTRYTCDFCEWTGTDNDDVEYIPCPDQRNTMLMSCPQCGETEFRITKDKEA